MPASLIKLYIEVNNTVGGTITTNTTTNVDAAVTRYTATVDQAMVSGGTTTILATSFVDDDGTALNAGGLPVPVDGYYNLYVNGVLQQAGLSTLTNAQLVINAEVLAGVSVVLEAADFAGTTSSSTSTQNLTVTATVET